MPMAATARGGAADGGELKAGGFTVSQGALEAAARGLRLGARLGGGDLATIAGTLKPWASFCARIPPSA
jgi:hypothetical protein